MPTTRTCSQSGIDNIDHHSQGLPQELQDEILLLTLIAGCLPEDRQVVISDEKCEVLYPSPWQLSVNRATREKVSRAYYSQNKFMYGNRFCGCSICNWMQPLYHWLKRLSSQSRAMILTIRLVIETATCDRLVNEGDNYYSYPRHGRAWDTLEWARMRFLTAEKRFEEDEMGMKRGVLQLAIGLGDHTVPRQWLTHDMVSGLIDREIDNS